MEINEITLRSYDPATGSRIISIRKLDTVKRIRSLIRALDTRKELTVIERELKEICFLIRNLPRRKKKLSVRQAQLYSSYNDLIESEKLPLRKLN